MADHQVHHGAAVLQIGTPSCTISHGAITPQTINHFTASASDQTIPNVDECKKWQKRTTINEWQQELTATNVAGVSHMMAKSIQIARVMPANMTHSTKILAVNGKQLSNDIIDPLFLWYLEVYSRSAVSR
jgi:hypothetical protein